MTKYLLSVILTTGLFSQAGCLSNSDTTKSCYAYKLPDTEKVFTKMLNKPHFKGGHDSLVRFLSANIDFEKFRSEISKNGTIFSDTARIKFIVSKLGSLSDLSVTLAKKKMFADEIARVIKESSCNWVAGRTEQVANGWFHFDIYFLVERFNKEVKTTMTVNEYVPTD